MVTQSCPLHFILSRLNGENPDDNNITLLCLKDNMETRKQHAYCKIGSKVKPV